jgi:glycerol uptake facilitator protein
MEERGPSAYVAEFLGTLILVFSIAMVLSLHQVSSEGLGYQDFAVIGFVHVFALAMLVASLGGTSGAHFNPAVTVALAALRKIRPTHAAIYVAVQLAGGVCGALLVRVILSDEGRAVKYGSVGISPKFLSGRTGLGFLCELIGTFLLMWAIMAAAVNPRAERGWAPWIIGGTLGFAVMIFGPLTGAGFNPARAFGPAVVGSGFGGFGTWLVAFVLGPIVGALLAATGYTALVLRPQGRAPGDRPIDSLD